MRKLDFFICAIETCGNKYNLTIWNNYEQKKNRFGSREF